jgi:hypothetical protein
MMPILSAGSELCLVTTLGCVPEVFGYPLASQRHNPAQISGLQRSHHVVTVSSESGNGGKCHEFDYVLPPAVQVRHRHTGSGVG